MNIIKEKLIRYIYFLKTSKSDWSYVKKRNLAQLVVQEWRGMWQGSGWQLGGRRGQRAGSQITGSRSPNQTSFVVYKVQHMSQNTHSTIMALQVSTSLLLSTTLTRQFESFLKIILANLGFFKIIIRIPSFTICCQGSVGYSKVTNTLFRYFLRIY